MTVKQWENLREADTPMTPGQFYRRMKELHGNGDTEEAHGDADALMGLLLTKLGYGQGVKAFNNMKKWYA